MTIYRVGVDIAKSVFHVHGVDRHYQVQWRGKYPRAKWLDAIANRVPVGAEIAMEACASSHYWARELQARGYHVSRSGLTPYADPVIHRRRISAHAEAKPLTLSHRTMAGLD